MAIIYKQWFHQTIHQLLSISSFPLSWLQRSPVPTAGATSNNRRPILLTSPSAADRRRYSKDVGRGVGRPRPVSGKLAQAHRWIAGGRGLQ
jgi:hypothetical protein